MISFFKKHRLMLAAFALFSTLFCVSSTNNAFACKHYWIKGLYEDRQVVQLNDGSLWQVKGICSAHVKQAQWEQGTNVLLCHEDKNVMKLKNIDVDENKQEWVFVKLISSVESVPDSCPHQKKQ